MRRVALGVLLAVPLLASAGPTKPADITMSWIVSVDRAGKLGAMTPTEDRNKGLYERLEAGIRKYWVFRPGKLEGRPETTETTLTVHVTLEPVDNLWRVRVRDAATGPRYDKIVAPRYPDDAIMSHRGGGVLLEVRYDAAGKVTDAKTLIPETVGGHGLAGKALVPLCFAPTPATRTNCRWETGETKKPLDPDRPLGLESVAQIETDVTAHEL